MINFRQSAVFVLDILKKNKFAFFQLHGRLQDASWTLLRRVWGVPRPISVHFSSLFCPSCLLFYRFLIDYRLFYEWWTTNDAWRRINDQCWMANVMGNSVMLHRNRQGSSVYPSDRDLSILILRKTILNRSPSHQKNLRSYTEIDKTEPFPIGKDKTELSLIPTENSLLL